MQQEEQQITETLAEVADDKMILKQIGSSINEF